MKIRIGFVSNSSSSSFILEGTSVRKIASYMLHVVLLDWRGDQEENPVSKKVKESSEETYKKWERNLIVAFKTPRVKSGKIGIVLPSCNYDSYIMAKDEDVYVSTCHNQYWDFESKNSVLYNGGGADEGSVDKVHGLISKSFFYNIRNSIIHSVENFEINIELYCKKCKKNPFSFFETPKGTVICAECYGKLGKTPSRIIEELQKNSKKNMSAFKYLEP